MRYLRTFEIPVEIFLFFLINNGNAYTVGDVQYYLKQNFKVELSDIRTRQILKAFYQSGKLTKTLKSTVRTRNVSVPHYSFNSLV